MTTNRHENWEETKMVAVPKGNDAQAAPRPAFMNLDRWSPPPEIYLSRPCDCLFCREKSRSEA